MTMVRKLMSSSRKTITDTNRTIDWAIVAFAALLLLDAVVELLLVFALAGATIRADLIMVGVAEKAADDGIDEGKTLSNDMDDRLAMEDRK
jgi:hypothetical protein